MVVPSIAIREGVAQSIADTAEHFLEGYGKRVRSFIYDSKALHNLESFSSDSGINVMIINVQAFNARGKDARRIYEELDDFQSRRPIDVIAANRPILILDEPQKMEGARNLANFAKSLQKGQLISLEGKIKYRAIEENVKGQQVKYTIAEIHASSIRRLSKVEAADDPSDGADEA